jgi:hypothetical protein
MTARQQEALARLPVRYSPPPDMTARPVRYERRAAAAAPARPQSLAAWLISEAAARVPEAVTRKKALAGGWSAEQYSLALAQAVADTAAACRAADPTGEHRAAAAYQQFLRGKLSKADMEATLEAARLAGVSFQQAVRYQRGDEDAPDDGQQYVGEAQRMRQLEAAVARPGPGRPRPISRDEMRRALVLHQRARDAGRPRSWEECLEQIVGARNPAPAVSRPEEDQPNWRAESGPWDSWPLQQPPNTAGGE